jgi:hypothetical protein
MTPLAIEAIGLCAGGLPDWTAARAVLRGEAPFVPAPPPRLTPAALPATERRRANDAARWALQVAGEAVHGMAAEAVAALPTIFASADGDGDVLAQVLRDIAAAPVTVSPTTFHNSVYNAPAGYWSIAAQAPAASTTLCAADGSFAAGLLEAAAQIATTAQPVLLVTCDLPFPAHCPLRTEALAAFACALLLAPAHGARAPLGRIDDVVVGHGVVSAPPRSLGTAFIGNGAAAALPLLEAAAQAATRTVSLPYVGDQKLVLRWTPGA